MIDDGKISGLLQEGIKLSRVDDYEEAALKFEKIIKIDRTNVLAMYHLALCYANMKEYDKAIDMFDRIDDKIVEPLKLLQIHFVTGYIYAVREMYELAEIEFKEVLKMGISNAQVHSAIAYVYDKKHDFDMAIFHLKEALKIDPNNANAKNSLGYVMVEAGENIDDAIKEIRDALDLSPDNPAYFDSLGWAYFKKGDMVNARRYLTKAFEIAPNVAEIKEHLKQVKQISM